MEWILTTMEEIDSIKDLEKIVNDYTIWNEYVKEVKELMETIKDKEEAVKDRDHKAIGDMLIYKVLPSFENMKSKLLADPFWIYMNNLLLLKDII